MKADPYQDDSATRRPSVLPTPVGRPAEQELVPASVRPGLAGPAGVVAMQRAAGNKAVSGLIARQPHHAVGEAAVAPAAVAVQRDGTGGTLTEFKPLIGSDPVAASSIRLFEHHIHTWKMANWRTAPAGTNFHWGWAVEGDGILQTIGDNADDQQSTELIWVQGRKPGVAQIQGTPVHQVPGGPQVTGDTRRVPITVAPPTLDLMSLSPRHADGSGGDLDHLSVGDKVIARVRVGNVDGEHMDDPATLALSGTGLGNVDAGSATRVQGFPDGRSYDVEFTVTAPAASLNLQIELGLGDMALGTGPRAGGIHGEIEMDRQEFLNAASQCDTMIELAYTRANSVFEVLSSAYGNAYESHEQTLKAQDASNNLLGEILLNAALAFIPGGVGGVVGGFMKNAEAGEFFADAVKDLAKAGARGIQNAAIGGGRLPAGQAMTPMAADPRTWRATEAVRVNAEKEKVLADLNEWKAKARARTPEFFLNFDPAVKMAAALVRDGAPLKDTPVPDQPEHQRLFELGMWKEWLSLYGYTVGTIHSYPAGRRAVAEENQGKKIRDRINQLGADGDAFLEQYGGISKAKAEEEAKRRNGGF